MVRYTLVIPGCTNDSADNYDPSANMDNSSSIFNNTLEQPFIYISNPINGVSYLRIQFQEILLSLFHLTFIMYL